MFLNLVCFFNLKIYLRCEDKPTDLPKKATLPSVQTDTMSIAEEDFNMAARLFLILLEILLQKYSLPFRGSITSYTKVSRNSSFRFDTQTSLGSPPVSPSSPGSGKTVSVFRSLMNNIKRSETEDEGSGGNLERVTSKHSRRSGVHLIEEMSPTLSW